MSIFQSSFPLYIFKQLKIREAILQQGNDNSRFGRPQAKFTIGKKLQTVNIAQGAFYTNTIERQCTIRMSSGVNISGSNDMAQRFVLEGGTDREGGGQRDGFGIRGRMNEKNKKWEEYTVPGAAYGDPRIFADADDGFGIVPMPGIVDANIRTKSAYGSLREAKVNFVCHNRRQLEVLERLYMRPGFPIMLEWGWTPFIANSGDIETHIAKIGGFFTEGSKIQKLQDQINKRKVDTGGNYDGFLGICKNFEFKATPAGGYECSTDIIAMGEVLEGLKGRRSGKTILIENEETEVDNLEFYLHSIKHFASEAFTREEKMGGKDALNLGTSAALFKTFQDLAKTIDSDRVQLFEAIDEDEAMTDLQIHYRLYKQSRMLIKRYKTKSKQEAFEKYVSEMDSIESLLDKFIINKGEKIETNSKKGSPYTYIRWDFFCHIMNTHILEEYQKDENIAELSWHDKNNSYYDYVRTITDPEVKVPLTADEKTGDVTSTFPLSRLLDMSLNPSKALLPHQIPWVETVGKKFGDHILIKDSKGKNVGHCSKNSIGMIFLGVDYLLEKYKGMRYNSDGDLNGDFKILNFLKEVWEKDINDVCAGSHNFMLHHDKEETTKVRVIDLIFQSNLQPPDLYEFNIQDNKSIVRDFNFNTTIPSALSATMAVVAQNPDSINDMEGVTISSMNKLLTSRFSQPIGPFNNDKEIYEARLEDEEKLLKSALKLYQYTQNIRHGEYNETTTGIEEKNKPKPISVSKAMSSYKSIIDLIESLLVRYPLTDDNNKEFILDGVYKAGHKRTNFKSTKSSIIPLKFTCKMDGIGGIVIGNVFKINKNRLPIGYQGKDIAFMTHAESQTITSGQDWTTEISGQLLLLDLEDKDGKEYQGYIISPGDLVSKNVLENENSPTPHADIVRDALEALRYEEKHNDNLTKGRTGNLAENGDITEEMKDVIISILAKIAELYPSVEIMITAGNDSSHKNSQYSRHRAGNAIDITINNKDFKQNYLDVYGPYSKIKKHAKDGTSSKLNISYEGKDAPPQSGINLPISGAPPSPSNGNQNPDMDGGIKRNVDQSIATINSIIKGFIGAPSADGKLRYLNEYFYPTKHASMGHFHISRHVAGGSEGGPNGFKVISAAQNYTGAGFQKDLGSIDNLTFAEQTVKRKIPVWLVDEWTNVPGYNVNSYGSIDASTLKRGGEVTYDQFGNPITGDPYKDFDASNQGAQGTNSTNYSAGGLTDDPNAAVNNIEITDPQIDELDDPIFSTWDEAWGSINDSTANPSPQAVGNNPGWGWKGVGAGGYWTYLS